jgi:hypothetical protein
MGGMAMPKKQKAEISIDSLHGIDKNEKETFKGLADLLALEAHSVTGRKRVAIAVNDDQGAERRISVTSEMAKQNRETTVERNKAKIIKLGIDEELKATISNKVDRGTINGTHISDIRQSDASGDLSTLDSSKQEKVIAEIVDCRNSLKAMNMGIVATAALQTGIISPDRIERWYFNVDHLISMLIPYLDMNEKAIRLMAPMRRRRLAENLKILITASDTLLLKTQDRADGAAF